VHNFAISLDGYAAGPDQSQDHPLGVGGPDGYTCTEFVSSPSVAHVRLCREPKEAADPG
jgi:hypothetical protein